ncbi:AfsR/SARP family transcriptional regulator [Streptomyces sp. NBC_00669]|uniref:AfsR/SARP family transcriptional regulator n=1 Tax=Streptomyces sp. NBC_00669 TaxID=2976011 RepID=UPI003FA68658
MTSAEPPTGERGGTHTRFTVLGMLTLADGRESVVLQPSRPAALLAALLLHANSVVTADFLQQVIWGADTPAQAKAALHSCVLRLRRLFSKYGVADNAIEAVPGGYRLTADAAALDLVEFRELLGRAYSAAEPEKELGLLRTALALWRPPLLSNVHSDLLHRDEVPRLEEEWLRAIERVFDLELARGRYREAVAEIWPTARAHPLHERFTGQLMEALYRTGRRAEALAEYRKAKEHLAQQLGVDPGPDLQRLELAILRGAHADGPRPAAATSAAGSTDGPDDAQDSQDPRGTQDAQGTRDNQDSLDGALSGARVLDRLVGAGLLEEGPRGHYRMHDLLRVFTRAAAADGVGARAARTPRASGRTPHPSPRPGAAELHPTEA